MYVSTLKGLYVNQTKRATPLPESVGEVGGAGAFWIYWVY